MDNTHYLKHLKEFNKEKMLKFIDNKVLTKSRYIFVENKADKSKIGYCTHCKKEFTVSNLKHNKENICPKCKSICTVKHAYRGYKSLMDRAAFIYYERSKKDPNILTATGYFTERYFNNGYKEPVTNISPVAYYIFDMTNKKAVQFMPDYWGADKYRETKSIYSFNINWLSNMDYVVDNDNIKMAIKSSGFRYCPLNVTDQTDDKLKLFELYVKYPIIEQLSKVGMTDLIKEKLNKSNTYYSLNLKGNDIYKVLRINRKDLKDILESKVYVSPLFLKLFQMSKKEKANLTIEQIIDLECHIGLQYERFTYILNHTTLRKAYTYMQKQSKKSFYIVTIWRDYLLDCKTLNYDLTSEHILFPKDVQVAHQNTIKQIQIKANEKLDLAIKKRLRTLNKYLFETDKYLIRPAKSTSELINEGKTLNHCVASHYSKPYSEGKTDILFIRSKTEPDKPLCTVEVKNKEIVQARAKSNKEPDKEIKEFVELFKIERLTIKAKTA